MKDAERLEPLGGGVSVIVNDTHHFSTDTILLAHFSQAFRARAAVELCSGCGTISLIWAKSGKIQKIDAVEIQPEACDMLARSAALNHFEDRLTVYCRDIRCLKGTLPFGFYNLVACNPPYKPAGSGLQNPLEDKRLARHECECTIEDAAAAASGLLQFGGRFCVCQRPERLTDVLEAMRANNLEPKRLRFVQQRSTKEPKLFLAEGRKGGGRGFMRVEPALLIENADGGFSQEMLEIYGDYKNYST